MKLITHDRSPKPEKMELPHDPMIVWVDKLTELRIERGDTLRDVVETIRPFYPHLKTQGLMELVAFWFALGERRALHDPSKPWTDREMRTDVKRKYLIKS